MTSLTERKDALDRIGRMIARRININYFDCTDVSNKNVIRHVEAGITNKVPDDPKRFTTKRPSVMVEALEFF